MSWQAPDPPIAVFVVGVGVGVMVMVVVVVVVAWPPHLAWQVPGR
ncbi:MAG: hypothetical protein ACK5N0_10010 [Synechococcaceae cyanobacterium]